MIWDDGHLNIDGATISNSFGADGVTEGGNGGGVAARARGVINARNCFITDNKSNNSSSTNGAGFFLTDNSSLIIDNCTFSGNTNRSIGGRGNQGGGIYAEHSRISIINSTFNVAKGFNTGGAIRTYGGSLQVDNSTFTIGNLGDAYGVSGGAITIQSTYTQITNSTFSAPHAGTKVTHAGGFISISDRNPSIPQGAAYPHGLTIKNSTFTGPGSWWNGPTLATYGGAIAFDTDANENPNTYTALFEGLTFRNLAADTVGGAIAISTSREDRHINGGVNLTIKDSAFANTRTNLAWKPAFGGTIFNGEGNTLTVEGGSIRDAFSVYGGALFNDGTATLTGGLTITNTSAYHLGGGSYNNGKLTVDAATFTNTVRTPDLGVFKGDEFGGNSIYARKDVTITPNATFDTNDVRVLDKESAILLTGTLTKRINVTISEKPNTDTGFTAESQKRHLGYLVAKGTDSYQPTFADANFLHYQTNNTNAAAFDDHTSLGVWDYVLTPERNIVLGQRGEVIYNPNTGSIDGVSANLVQLYTVYSPTMAYPDETLAGAAQLTPTTKRPERSKFNFVGWYAPAGPHSGTDNTVTNEVAFNFSRFFGNGAAEVTDILNPNSFTAHAGWKQIWDVTYKFVSNDPNVDLPLQVLAHLPQNQLENIHGSNVAAVAATFPSVRTDEGEWVFLGWNPAETAVNGITADHSFVGTWKLVKEWNVTYEFVSADSALQLPVGVTSQLPAAKNKVKHGSNIAAVPTTFNAVEADGGTWSFVSWDKDTAVNSIAADHNFVGTWKFTKNWNVTYEFVSGTEGKVLPTEVTDLLPPAKMKNSEGSNVPAVADSFNEVSVADGKWVFAGWNPAETAVNNITTHHNFIGTWVFHGIVPPVTPAEPKQPEAPKVIPPAPSLSGTKLELPKTGANAASLLAFASVLLVAGISALIMRRRQS